MSKNNKIFILVFIVFILFIFFAKSSSENKKENLISQEIESEEIYQFSTVNFNNTSFDVVKVESKNINSIKFYYKNKNNQKIETINQLKDLLKEQKKNLVFATNGGIFSKEFKPLGLYIENGKEISKINLNEGEGNFYFQPNGIFSIQNNKVEITESKKYQNSSEVSFAIQSGPMLLIDNKINSLFNEKSENKHIRNGVGITENGSVIFVISNELVTFYNFALFFKEDLNCKNALYLDGAISEMYVSEQRKNVKNKFSVMIGIVDE
ncbi:MAG: phosphodiester glycosidase family protein [Candidatus Moranbacteria bacterium]|nr:phosphodiester glycosidase family protein [Candidatus Moranbacteria bacterium]